MPRRSELAAGDRARRRSATTAGHSAQPPATRLPWKECGGFSISAEPVQLLASRFGHQPVADAAHGLQEQRIGGSGPRSCDEAG